MIMVQFIVPFTLRTNENHQGKKDMKSIAGPLMVSQNMGGNESDYSTNVTYRIKVNKSIEWKIFPFTMMANEFLVIQ